MMFDLTMAHAQAPAIGSKIGNAIDLGGRTVPLPQGIWTVVATDSGPSAKHHPLIRIYLAELQNGKLWRWLYIVTNVDYTGGSWVRNKDYCDRKNTHFAYSDSWNSPTKAECWIVNHWGEALGSNPPQVSIDFYRWSDMLGRPNTSIGTAYYFSRKGEFLTVEYHINPVLAGFPDTPTALWRGSPWHVDVASKDPKKLDALREVKAAGELYFERLRTVLH
jgi:hypothetical protein